MRSVLAYVSLYVLAVLLIPLLGGMSRSPASNPRSAITVPCEIIEWYDGDTCTVRVTLDARVRLLQCYCPEIKTKDETEKARGYAARDHAATTFPVGSKGVLEVPLEGMDRFDDAITLGRVLGNVWVDGQSVAEEQVKAGHATSWDVE